MASPQLENLVKMLWQRNELMPEFSVESLRASLDNMASFTPIPKDVQCEEVDAGGVPAIWVETPGANPDNVILHFHGGGGIAGNANLDREICGRLSRETGSRVLSVDYRLGPENPFPAGIDDALAAYQWLLSTGTRPDHVIFAGESKGAHFSLVTLLQARDAGLPLPVAGVLVSPDTDVNFIWEGLKGRIDEDPFLSLDALRKIEEQYVGDADRADPRISPYLADLAGLPPLLVQAGSSEILLDDATRFAEKAQEQGIEMQVDVIEGGIHAMVVLPPVIPESVQALNTIATFVGKYFKEK